MRAVIKYSQNGHVNPPHTAKTKGDAKMDYLMISGMVAFFLVALAYTSACERLK
jgi:hypothetical protein